MIDGIGVFPLQSATPFLSAGEPTGLTPCMRFKTHFCGSALNEQVVGRSSRFVGSVAQISLHWACFQTERRTFLWNVW